MLLVCGTSTQDLTGTTTSVSTTTTSSGTISSTSKSSSQRSSSRFRMLAMISNLLCTMVRTFSRTLATGLSPSKRKLTFQSWSALTRCPWVRGKPSVFWIRSVQVCSTTVNVGGNCDLYNNSIYGLPDLELPQRSLI